MYKFYLKAVSNAPKVAETLVTNKSIVVLTNKTALSRKGPKSIGSVLPYTGKFYPGLNKK